MKKKIFGMVSLILTLMMILPACGQSDKTAYELSYSTGINSKGLYDNSLFYRNDLDFKDAADPGAIFVDGYYYIFPTGAPIRCYKTKNFANWELVGYAFEPNEDSWAYGNFWAPEVIKSKTDGKFYMYYSASTKGDIEGVGTPGFYTDRLKMSVAVSDNVCGPYVECKDSKGNYIVFDIAASSKGQELLANKTAKVWAALDASPFYDGDDLYLYFAKSRDVNFNGNDIFAMKMKSMIEPDYSTLKRLTRAGYSSAKEDGAPLAYEEGCDINEGANMIKHTTIKDGKKIAKYYLSYSMYGFNDRRYSVGVAVSDSPLGDFVKLDAKFNQPLLGISTTFDHMSGTGHHQFIETDDDFFVIYHAHKDSEAGGTRRAIAADRVQWIFNEELGYDILHANGPSYSLQPVPNGAGEYKNIIKDAVITATNIKNNSKIDLLSDSIVSIHSYDKDKDFVVSAEGAQITIEFSQERSVRALMVYNSYESYLAFSKIDDIIFENAIATYSIKELDFPMEYYSEDKTFMRPGGAAIAEFNEIKVKKITFTIKNKLYNESNADYDAIALSELCVLGK